MNIESTLRTHDSRKASITTILIATSLRPASDRVVRTGLELAKTLGAQAILVHGLPTEAAAVLPGEPWVRPSLLSQLLAAKEIQLEEQAVRLGTEVGLTPRIVVGIGAPHRTLREEAIELRADLVVVGACEREGRMAGWLGTTADRVLRSAVCPVLIVRGELAVPPRSALFPVDLSPLSGKALDEGLEILRHLCGSTPPEIEALWVVSPRENAGSPATELERLDLLTEERLAPFVAENARSGAASIRSVVAEGEPRAAILAELERNPRDLVVMATHGRSGFERRLLGSLAAELVRDAPTSVLVLPPDEMRGEAEERRRVTQRRAHVPVTGDVVFA